MMKKYRVDLKYFNLNKDIILVEGACGGLIQDLKNRKLYSIDAISKKCLTQLISGKKVVDVLSCIEDKYKVKLLNYLQLLVDKNLGFFSEVWIKTDTFEKADYCKLDTVWLELRKACNLKCSHCYMDSNSNRDNSMELLGLEQWKQVIVQLREYNPKRIILIGGEPLLFKELIQLIEFIRDENKQIEIVLYSNLTLLTDKVVECIIQNEVRVITSIYSRRRDVHDQITNYSGSYDNTVKNVKRLKSKGVYVQANAVIMKYNFDEIHSIQDFLYELTGQRGKLDLVRNVGKEKSNLLPELYGMECGQIKGKPNFKGISKQEFIKNYSGNSCWQGKINITCTGEISPCIMGEGFINSNFNVRTHPLKEIIQEYLKKDMWSISRDNIEVCCDCEYRYVCKDCRPVATRDNKIYLRESSCKYNPYERKWNN